MRPGPAVLASFGASADPVSLPGGEGTLLAHAHVYRLVTEVVVRRGNPGSLETVARTSQPVTMLLMQRLAAGRIRGPRHPHDRK